MVYKFYNERDIEGPALVDFVKSHPVSSALDMGAHWSWSYYAREVKKMIPSYEGIDIIPDPVTERIIDRYIVGNVLHYDKEYDMVFSISSIEHAGISTYRVEDYKKERLKVFVKMLTLARKYLFITFPFGEEAFHENQFANITGDELDMFIMLGGVKLRDIHTEFYFSEAPQKKAPYLLVERSYAEKVAYVPELGTRCSCIISFKKDV